jgi:hypothetical protein
VTGIGLAPEGESNRTRREQSALRSAQLVADRNFVQWVNGAELESVTIVEQGTLTTDEIREIVRGRVFGGTVIEEKYDDITGTAEVTMEYTVRAEE